MSDSYKIAKVQKILVENQAKVDSLVRHLMAACLTLNEPAIERARTELLVNYEISIDALIEGFKS